MFAQMFTQLSEQYKDFADQAGVFSNPMLEFNRLAISQAQTLGQKQLELVNKYSNHSLKQLSQMQYIKSADDVAQLAKENMATVNSLSEHIISDTNQWIGLAQQFGEEWKQFIEGNMSQTRANATEPDSVQK